MAKAYEASMPDGMDLGGGWTIRLVAIDPTTGNSIPAVQVGNLVMLLEAAGGTAPVDLSYGPFQLVPGPGA